MNSNLTNDNDIIINDIKRLNKTIIMLCENPSCVEDVESEIKDIEYAISKLEERL